MSLRRIGEWAGGYPLAAVAVATVVSACLPLRGQVLVPIMLMGFVPVILLVARISGAPASVFASVLTVVLVDVLFTRPYLRLTVTDPTEWVALAAFLTVALVVGGQTGKLRDRELAAIERRDELLFINRMLFNLAAESSLKGTVRLATNRIRRIAAASRVAVYDTIDLNGANLLAEEGDLARETEVPCIRWVVANNKAIGLLGAPEADLPRPASVSRQEGPPEGVEEGIFVPLQTTRGVAGVLYLRVDALDSEDSRTVIAVANLLGALLERDRIESEASALSLQHEAERLKATLVSSVSHELKTPLAAATAHVSGLLESVRQGEQDRLQEELELVIEELKRLNLSISDLLDLARLQSASWKPRPDTYEVSEILATTLSRLSNDQQRRVQFSLPAEVPFVFVDFTQMVQVFLNILQNALDYSPASEKVRVRVSSDQEWVRVTFEDHGPGIPDAEKEKVFDQFYRGKSARGARGGTGLGLAITREIVATAGGRISVEDAAGGGALFEVSIPLAVIGANDE